MYIIVRDILLYVAIFVALCLIAVVSVYLAVTLRKINKLIGNVNRVVETNEQNVAKVLTDLPATIENVNEVVTELKNGLNKAGDTFKSVEQAVTETVAAAGEKSRSLFVAINTAIRIIKAVKSFFGKQSSKK